MNYLYKCLLSGLLFGCLPLISIGQVISGSVYSRQLGLPLSDVTITVTGTELSGNSNHEGRFFIAQLPIGESELVFQKNGFENRKAVVEYQRGQDTISVGISMCPLPGAFDRQQQSVAWKRSRDNQKTPQAVASMNQHSFRELPARNIAQVAASLPGTSMLNQHFSSTTPVIRGFSGRHILLLKDDIPLLPVTLGEGASPWWLTVDPTLVDRLEVMRGTSSSAYGNNATGGVISAYSPSLSFSDGGSQVHAEAGTRFQPGSRELGGHGRLALHSDGISLGLQGYRRELGSMPLSAASTAITPGGYQTLGGQGQLGIRLAPQHRLDVTIGHHMVKTDSTPGLSPARQNLSLRRKQLSLRWTGHFANPLWETIRVTAARQEFDQDQVLNRSLQDQRVHEREDLHTFRAIMEVSSTPNWLWNAVSGVEIARHEVESQAWINPPDGPKESVPPTLPNGAVQEEIGIYSLHTLDILKLRLAFGGRAHAQRVYWDDQLSGQISWAPQAMSGNISAMFPLTRDLEITSSFRTGFRQPGLADIRGRYPVQGNNVLVPSDSLATERIFSSEIGLKTQTKHFSGSLVLYHAQMNDWIRQVASSYQGSPVWQGLAVLQSRNMDQGFVQGVEAEVEVPVYKQVASVYGSLTYTHGINLSQSSPLPAIPPVNSRLGLRYHPGHGFWTRLEWRHASAQRQLSASDMLQNPNGTDGWDVVDLHLGYDFRWGYLMLGLENAFDARFRMHGSDIESPGRLLIFSMQIGF